MVNFRDFSKTFTFLSPTAPAAVPLSSASDIIKETVENIWKDFKFEIKKHFRDPIHEIIQVEIDKLDKIEAAATTKPVFLAELRRSLMSVMKSILEANVDPIHPPRQVAFQLTNILVRFGLACYENRDMPHPFQSSLDVLKAALLMQHYALGLSNCCPDLSSLRLIDKLYSEKEAYEAIRPLADYAINQLNPALWSAKTFLLTEKQQLLIPDLLRYINGALRGLDQLTLRQSELLLQTAEECLKSAKTKHHYNQIEVNNHLAELKYNDFSGLLARQIKDLQVKGETEKVAEKQVELEILWIECAELSKEPEKMRARCENKRIFINEMALKDQLEQKRSGQTFGIAEGTAKPSVDSHSAS